LTSVFVCDIVLVMSKNNKQNTKATQEPTAPQEEPKSVKDTQKAVAHQDGQFDDLESPDCPETKKRNFLKETFTKFIPILTPVKEGCSKNEAAYLAKKRKRKIRNAIIFGVFSAIIAAIITISIIFGNSFLYIAGGSMESGGYYPGIFDHAGVNWFVRQANYIYHIFSSGLNNSTPNYTRAFVVVTLGYILITVAHFIIKLFSKGDNKRRKTVIALIASLVKYIGYLVIIIFLFEIFNVNQAILAAIIAALGLAVGFGAQGVLSDLLTGLFLIFENSLQVGDIITVDGFRGEVEEIGMRTTRFTSVNGDVKVINNSQFKKFINMSMHRSLATCNFIIEYGENIEKVELLIAEKIADIAENYECVTEGPYYKGVVEFNDRGVMLRVVAKCDETKRLQLERDLNREFKILFDDNNVRLAVPKIQICDSTLRPGTYVAPTPEKPEKKVKVTKKS